jgi:hypothetical protein
MAKQIFTSSVTMERFLNVQIATALKSTSGILCEKLKEFIQEDYYNLFKPDFYTRTYQFLDSAKNELLSGNTAKIYMDETAMDYGNYWDGETQLYMADAGLHGNANIFREGYFWKDFINYCNENVDIILRQELKKVGINVKH